MKQFPCLILLLAFCGCATGPTFYSEDYLAGMAATEFSKIKEQYPIAQDPVATAMVNRVSSRIAQTLGDEMPEADWEYVLFEDESANAFAMPGGKIAVFTGLMELMDSDDELAVVIGHEIAHVLLRHANQRMSAELIRGGVGVLVVAGTSNMEDDNRALALAAFGLGSQVGVMLPYSRSHEKQADRMGLMIAARSGYDPRAAITFWEKMAEAGGSSMPEFLSTHPGYGTRIETLNEAMPEAMRYYQASLRP